MKKVLFVITKSNWGGAQRYVFDVATNLDRTRFEPVVAMGGTGGAGAGLGLLHEKLSAAKVRTIVIPSFMRDISIAKEFSALRELYDLFKAEKPDVVHLNSSKAGGLGALAARLAGVRKIVFTVHGLPYREERGLLWRLAARLGTHATALLCHTVIVVSLSDKEDLPGARLIHNGIAPVELLLKEDARAKLAPGAPRGGLWVGALGELTWNKGCHYLLRAAQMLKRDGKQFSLVVLGDGEERQFLETLVADEGLQDTVSFAGFVPEGARYLRAFDIFALASVKEGLPYVLMEAGLAGLPVVATNVGGVSDIIGDGISGLLVKPKNEHELAKKLGQLIDDAALRSKFGEALQKRVAQEFSIATMVQATQEAY